jgi:hypothetical protein
MNGFTGRLSENEKFLLNGKYCSLFDMLNSDLHTKRDRKIQQDYDNDYFWYDQIGSDDENDDHDDPLKVLEEIETNFTHIANDDNSDDDNSDQDSFLDTKKSLTDLHML